jgi:1,4-alpha-glucan branching enzyme
MLFCRRQRVATKVTFVLPFDEPAGEVSVIGDFNDWEPGAHVLTRSTYGTRAVSLTLPTGWRFAFRYVSADGRSIEEPDAHRAEDGNHIVVT